MRLKRSSPRILRWPILKLLLVTIGVLVVFGGVDILILWLTGIVSFGDTQQEFLKRVSLCSEGTRGAAICHRRAEGNGPLLTRIIAFDSTLHPPVRDLTVPESQPTVIARCSLTGRIFVGCEDGSLLLYDAADAAASPVLIGRHVSADSTEYSHIVMEIVISKDGRYLASQGGCNVIVWDLAGRRHIQLERDGRCLRCAAFIHPGTLVTGTTEGELLLWCMATGRLLRSMATHTASIKSIALPPTGDSLAAIAEDGMVHVWDVATGIRRWSHSITRLYGSAQMAFATDGVTLAISSSRDMRHLWIYNAETGSLVANLKPSRTGIISLAFREDRSLRFFDEEGTLWNLDATGTERRWSFGSFSPIDP